MQNKPRFDISLRKSLDTNFLSIAVTRMIGKHPIVRNTPEIVFPALWEYNEAGDVINKSLQDLLKEFKPSPYYPGTKDFSIDRVEDVWVDQLYTHFQSFPNVGYEIYNGERRIHPLSDFIWTTIMMLRPDENTLAKLKKLDVIKSNNIQGKLYSRAIDSIESQHNVKIDRFSVPKRKVGSLIYVADEAGYSLAGKIMSFGMHKNFPSDRLVRELSSLHNAERFASPKGDLVLPESIKPYWTLAKVLVLHTEEDMLDTGIISPEGCKTFACVLERLDIEPDLSKVKPEDRNIKLIANKASVEGVHVKHIVRDETKSELGTIRLVMPGGVKFAASPFPGNFDCSEGAIDLVMDFRTFSRKGSVGLFWWDDPSKLGTSVSNEELNTYVRNKLADPNQVFFNGHWYSGHILYIPVARPGQRYEDLCKPSFISTDLVTKAILNQKLVPSSYVEREYQLFRNLINTIGMVKQGI